MSEQNVIPGGWKINPSENLPQGLASFISEKVLGATIEPLALLGTQLVNGVNYALLCKITLSTNPTTTTLSKVVVHSTFTGEYSIISQEAAAVLDIPGGFKLNFSYDKMPEDVATTFSELLSPMYGGIYEPVAYVGKQIVKELNHMVLAKQTLILQQLEEHMVLVVVNGSAVGDPESEFTVVSIDRLV